MERSRGRGRRTASATARPKLSVAVTAMIMPESRSVSALRVEDSGARGVRERLEGARARERRRGVKARRKAIVYGIRDWLAVVH